MQVSVLSLFPEIVEFNLNQSILAKAKAKGVFNLQTVQIRDFAINSYGQVDDAVYGGGTGILLRPEPIYDAYLHLTANWSSERLKHAKRYYLSPKGKRFDQKLAKEWSEEEDLIFLCGHYEGVDYRVLEELDFTEVSLGDFILTGGESAVSVMLEATLRLIPGVLPNNEAHEAESFSSGLLEEKQYTRPEIWHDKQVAHELISGNQAKIKQWRYESALLETLQKRPDLLAEVLLDENAWLQLLSHIDN